MLDLRYFSVTSELLKEELCQKITGVIIENCSLKVGALNFGGALVDIL